MTTAFSDTELHDNQSYNYEIFAVDDNDNSSLSPAGLNVVTVADQVPPAVVSVAIMTESTLHVTFSEPVEENSAEEIANYGIFPHVAILSAELQPDLKTVVLATAAHTRDTLYHLSVQHVLDRATQPNIMPSVVYVGYYFEPSLQVTNMTPGDYLTAILHTGDTYYIDRTYQILSIPADFENMLWIKTANRDKLGTSNPFLTFQINADVTVYIGIEDDRSKLPWMDAEWTDTAKRITTNDGNPLLLWMKDFNQGVIQLGGNHGTSSSSMYVVLIKAQFKEDRTPPSPPEGVKITH